MNRKVRRKLGVAKRAMQPIGDDKSREMMFRFLIGMFDRDMMAKLRMMYDARHKTHERAKYPGNCPSCHKEKLEEEIYSPPSLFDDIPKVLE